MIDAKLKRNAKRGVLETISSAVLNQLMMVEEHPLPLPGYQFSALAGEQTVTKLDLSDAYNQLPLDDVSQQYLVINTQQSLYEYCRLPFCISSASALFQTVMKRVHKRLTGAVFFLNGILL